MGRSTNNPPSNSRKSRSSLNKSRVFSAQKSNNGVKSSKSKSQGSSVPRTRIKRPRNDTDIYEYTPEDTVRRSKVKLDLDKDEAMDGGGLFAEDEEFKFEGTREELRAKLIGEHEDGEQIDSGDDEEIDSDAAFEESDEERFAGFFSSKKKKPTKSKEKKRPQVRFADVDLNENSDDNRQDSIVRPGDDDHSEDDEEEEEESGEDDEFLDVLDVLDGRAKPYLDDDDSAADHPDGDPSHTPSSPAAPDRFEDSDAESNSEADGAKHVEEDNSAFVPSDDADDADSGALEGLHTFISGLETTSKKRKSAGDDDVQGEVVGAARPRKRRIIQEKSEAGVENEFGISSVGTKLNLDDLLGPLATQSSSLLSLKKATKVLSSSSKAKTLSAPLPLRTQERLDREAAYGQTKEEVQKWSETMKRIREAEHLSFPLQAQPTGRVSNLELVAKFKPTTPLENAVDKLLKSAKLREQDIQETEEAMLQTNKLSVQEVAQRRAELRKMRELMLRAELKARRANKIKSKTYRKLKRKERERLGEKIDEDMGSDDEESRMKHEIERARERATLKHKHTGKWAKQMKGREEDDTRKDIEEMLDRGEKLRRKIRGIDSDQSQEEGDGDSEEDDEDGDKIRQNAFDELKSLKQDVVMDGPGGQKKGKSIFEMKFMKDALARQQQATNKLVDDFVQEMGGEVNEAGEDGEDVDDEQDDVPGPSGVVTVRSGGRVVYRPGAAHPGVTRTMVRPMGSLASDTSSVTLQSTDLLSPPASPEQQSRPTVPLPLDEQNPWLSLKDTNSSKAPRKHNEVVVGKESKATEKSKIKMRKAAKKLEGEKAKAVDDATVEISMKRTLGSISQPAHASKNAGKVPNGKRIASSTTQNQSDDDDDSDVNSEVDAQEQHLSRKGKEPANGIKAFQQRDLVALAFAGDNVVQDFEAAKKCEIAADAPHEVDTTLPGWGSWGGIGTKRLPPKPHLIKKVAGVDPKSRADHGKSHVIISEKRDKKAAKYLVKDLPYPYTSQAQFERSMDRPLGKEWNTRVGFQRGTLPKVVKKMGVIIDPLEKLS